MLAVIVAPVAKMGKFRLNLVKVEGADGGWRNSFAPNDGYQHFDEVEKQMSNIDRRRSSARRQSSLVTEQEFKNQAYGMLRTQKNPKPNLTDRALHKIYQTAKLYIPMSTIVSFFKL